MKTHVPKPPGLVLSEVAESEWLIQWRICYWP